MTSVFISYYYTDDVILGLSSDVKGASSIPLIMCKPGVEMASLILLGKTHKSIFSRKASFRHFS